MSQIRRSLRALHFIIQGNNTIGKHFITIASLLSSNVLELHPETTKNAGRRHLSKPIIQRFLQLRESKIVYHL